MPNLHRYLNLVTGYIIKPAATKVNIPADVLTKTPTFTVTPKK